jgi:hypothetical protein
MPAVCVDLSPLANTNHEQSFAMLLHIDSIAEPKMLSQLGHPFAHWLHIAQQTERRLAKSRGNSLLYNSITKTFEPLIEGIRCLNCQHHSIVTNWLQSVK